MHQCTNCAEVQCNANYKVLASHLQIAPQTMKVQTYARPDVIQLLRSDPIISGVQIGKIEKCNREETRQQLIISA
jgi:hypothetical protein